MLVVLTPVVDGSPVNFTLKNKQNRACPNSREFDVCKGTTRFCARMWEHGHKNDFDSSCFGAYLDVNHGAVHSNLKDIGWNDRISSAIVTEGCELELYEHKDFGGRRLRLQKEDGYSMPKFDFNDKASSYKCNCFEAVGICSCNPFDRWETVMSCDNLLGAAPFICKHKVMVGTSVTNSVTEGGFVTQSISQTVERKFRTIEKSVSTGYFWSQTSSQTFSSQEWVEKTLIAPPGTVATLQQLVGVCADTRVAVNHFRNVS